MIPLAALVLTSALLAPAGGVTITPGDADGNGSLDLVITGNGKAQVVEVADVAFADTVRVSFDGDGDGLLGGAGDPSNEFTGPFELVDVRLGGGKDELTIKPLSPLEPGGAGEGRRRVYVIDLGSGKDRLAVDLHDQGFPDPGLVRIEADCGPGQDEVEVLGDCAMSDQATIEIALDLGPGRDFVFAVLPFYLHDFAEFSLDVQLGDGADEMRTRLDSLDLDTLSRMGVDVDGGDGSDSILLQPIEAVVPRALFGRFDYSARGGRGDDLVSFNVATPHSIDFSNTGNGRLRVRLDGGDDRDFVNFACANEALDEPRYDVRVDGGAGDDALLGNLANLSEDGNEVENYAAAGAILLNGGVGSDAAETMGNGRFREVAVP